jgi:hypothetical protein
LRYPVREMTEIANPQMGDAKERLAMMLGPAATATA